MNLTIKSVSPTSREWTGKFGPGASVKVWFESGEEGEYSTKPDKAREHIEAFQALIGVPGEYDVEPRGEYQGVPQLRIKGYPGKEPNKGFGGGYGGGKGATSWNYSEEGSRFHEERTDRRTCLMQAVQWCGESAAVRTTVLKTADEFYEWLRATERGRNHENVQNDLAPTRTFRPGNGGLSREIWEGPAYQCPKCNAPIGKFHGKPCIS